jgi:hypothetical protein
MRYSCFSENWQVFFWKTVRNILGRQKIEHEILDEELNKKPKDKLKLSGKWNTELDNTELDT